MELFRVDHFEVGQPVPDIGVNPDFERSVEGLKTGEVSQAVSLAGNRLAVAVVTGIIPARQKTFEEAQTEVRDRLVRSPPRHRSAEACPGTLRQGQGSTTIWKARPNRWAWR